MPAGMAASRLVVTKEIRRRRQAPVRLHAPEAARRGVATDAEPSNSPRPAATQRWARLGDLPARPGYFEVSGQPDALVAAGGHRTGRTRPANSRPVIACRMAARHHGGAIGGPSYLLAPVSLRPSGVPHASVASWHFAPGLPRSVGLGPLARPPSLAVTTDTVLTHPGSGRSHRPRASGAAGASNRAVGRDADAVQPLPSWRPASSVMRPSPVTAGVEQRGVTRSRSYRPSRPWRLGSAGSRLARDASGHSPALA
jgi:hypothetical protein